MAFYGWYFKDYLAVFRANPAVGSIIFFNLSNSTPVKLKIRPTKPPKGVDSSPFKIPASILMNS